MLTLREQQYFCLEHRFSKQKMTRYGKNWGGSWPPVSTYARVSITTPGQRKQHQHDL